jgi:PHD/YefM family antitoxin component YafN of YafNO toxin-antitoxin module
MTLNDAITSARYVVDANGRKTEVIIPVATWQHLLATYERLVTLLEDQEDREILREWLARRATGAVDEISLDELERELIADGLLPG